MICLCSPVKVVFKGSDKILFGKNAVYCLSDCRSLNC